MPTAVDQVFWKGNWVNHETYRRMVNDNPLPVADEDMEGEPSHSAWVCHLRFIVLELTRDAHKMNPNDTVPGMSAGHVMKLGRAIKACADYFEEHEKGTK